VNHSKDTLRRLASFVARKRKARDARARPLERHPLSLSPNHTFQKKTRKKENSVPDAINGFNFGAHMACAYDVPSLFMQK